jgi:DNA-directed RNA polymerase subunit E'/Rpb7
MSKIVSPYKNIKQFTRISIEPYHMNSDIRNNMKMILKKKVEKKCNKNGFIDEVFKILEYNDGIMIAENLNGSAIYNIAYHCRICIPIENTLIIATIKMISTDLIVAVNGPLFIFIPKNYIDNNIWDIPDGYLNKKTNTKLAVGNFVKIQIMDKRINQGDSQIKVMGKLLEIANEADIEKYYGSKIIRNPETANVITTEDTEETNFII